MKEGAFRQVLYFQLNVIQILIPPLRDRIGDIVPLTKFFIEHYNRNFKRNIRTSPTSAAKLPAVAHDWPGNIRELRNAIERAMILEERPVITPPSLPIAISRPDRHGHWPNSPARAPADGLSLEDNKAEPWCLGAEARAPRALIRVVALKIEFTLPAVVSPRPAPAKCAAAPTGAEQVSGGREGKPLGELLVGGAGTRVLNSAGRVFAPVGSLRALTRSRNCAAFSNSNLRAASRMRSSNSPMKRWRCSGVRLSTSSSTSSGTVT